jgi:TRAP-type C4-dicarboxylate transport system permease small subunit
MSIDDLFYKMYRVVSEPVLALFSSLTLIFGGYHLRKHQLEGDALNVFFPLAEKIGNVSLVVGCIILALFVVIKVAGNR